jgi:hypothetical protein
MRGRYAALNAVWFSRRKAMRPRLRKLRIIIAQVEGSGTAEIVRVSVIG